MKKDQMKACTDALEDAITAGATKGVTDAIKAYATHQGLASHEQEVIDWLGRCPEPTPADRLTSIRMSASLLAQTIVREMRPGPKRAAALAHLRDAVRFAAHDIGEEL